MSGGPSLGVLAGGAIAVAALLLAVLGAPIDRRPETRPAPVAAAPPGVERGGVRLVSAAIELPDDGAVLPVGPHADLVTERCTACHSASMIVSQPRLTPDQWAAEVKKMREAYHAPVADADVPEVLAYLTALSAAKH